MPIKSFRPTTPTRRFQTVVTRDEITKQSPEKGLVEGKKRTGGKGCSDDAEAFEKRAPFDVGLRRRLLFFGGRGRNCGWEVFACHVHTPIVFRNNVAVM